MRLIKSMLMVPIAAGLLWFAAPVAHATLINIQPILLCDTDSTGCADTQATGFLQYFEDAADAIWAQAGLDFNFLGMTQVNNSSLNDGVDVDSATQIAALLGSVVQTNMVLNMFFVENTFSTSLGGTLFGWACDNCLGDGLIGVAINDVIFGNEGLSTRIDTVAHEVGHILGLGHEDFGAGDGVPDNVMTSGQFRTPAGNLGDIAPNGLNRDQLTAAQIAEALSDTRYVKQVPEPSTLLLLAIGVLALGARRRLWA